MVLHKLTYVKDSKSKSLKGIKEYKYEGNQNLTEDLIKPIIKRNKTPIKETNKVMQTQSCEQNENRSVVMFKKARFFLLILHKKEIKKSMFLNEKRNRKYIVHLLQFLLNIAGMI